MPYDPLFDVAGRTVAITGANGEIGRHLVMAFVQRGAKVVALDLDPAVEAFADGAGATGHRVDLTDPAAVDRVIELLGPDAVDVLVNNAGINRHAGPLDVDDASWEALFGVNLRGAFVMSTAVARRRLANGLPLSIVNVSSTAASSALGRGNLVYGLTKAGLNQLTRELAIEWGPWGIRTNAVQPAQIATPAWNAVRDSTDRARYDRVLSGIPLGRLVEPSELVGPVLFLASDASSMVNGVVLPVDGGNLAFNASGSLTTTQKGFSE